MIHNKIDGLFKGILPDSRLEKRIEKVTLKMLTFGTSIVNRYSETHAERMGAYRALSNNRVKYTDLIKGLYKEVSVKQNYPHLLCIQDTSEINLSSHKDSFSKKDSHIGQLTKKGNIGFFCHPVLVVEPDQQIPLGFSSIKLYNRPWEQKNKYERGYKSLDIKNKESYRWISSVNKTKKVLSETPSLTIIGDRESDIFEEMVTVPNKKTNLLIRLSHNRNLYNNSKKLFEELSDSPKQTEFVLLIRANRKRENRQARIIVKYKKVKIQRPSKFSGKQYRAYVEMWAIEARESQETTPENESPILWRLLTTHQIKSIEDAITYIGWYKQRWLIEELFRVLKKQGLNIESSQLNTGNAVKKQTVLALHVALISMALKLSMQRSQECPAEIIFDSTQQDFLQIVNQEIEGKTSKQKNPYKANTLAWASWIIARLSGWSGYGTHGPPGYISMKRGLDVFYSKLSGYLIAIKYLKKDVYKE